MTGPWYIHGMLIAAHARSVKAVLVTNDLRHFTKVTGLKVEDWS